MFSQKEGWFIFSMKLFPSIIPCINRVNSDPKLNTILSGHSLLNGSKATAALTRYWSVSYSFLSHISGENHTSNPKFNAYCVAIINLSMSKPQIRAELQCRSFLIISNSRLIISWLKLGRQLQPIITLPTS